MSRRFPPSLHSAVVFTVTSDIVKSRCSFSSILFPVKINGIGINGVERKVSGDEGMLQISWMGFNSIIEGKGKGECEGTDDSDK